MYSYEDRMRAVALYLKLGKRVKATIREDRVPLHGVAYDGPMALARSELISFSAQLAG